MDLLVQAKPKAQIGKMFVRDVRGAQSFIELLYKEQIKKPIEVVKATKTVDGKSVKCSVEDALKHFNAGGTINVYVDGGAYTRQA